MNNWMFKKWDERILESIDSVFQTRGWFRAVSDTHPWRDTEFTWNLKLQTAYPPRSWWMLESSSSLGIDYSQLLRSSGMFQPAVDQSLLHSSKQFRTIYLFRWIWSTVMGSTLLWLKLEFIHRLFSWRWSSKTQKASTAQKWSLLILAKFYTCCCFAVEYLTQFETFSAMIPTLGERLRISWESLFCSAPRAAKGLESEIC